MKVNLILKDENKTDFVENNEEGRIWFQMPHMVQTSILSRRHFTAEYCFSLVSWRKIRLLKRFKSYYCKRKMIQLSSPRQVSLKQCLLIYVSYITSLPAVWCPLVSSCDLSTWEQHSNFFNSIFYLTSSGKQYIYLCYFTLAAIFLSIIYDHRNYFSFSAMADM